jgi:hypothetical protein
MPRTELKLTGGKDRRSILRRVALLRNTSAAQFDRRCVTASQTNPPARAAALKRLQDDLDLMRKYVWLSLPNDEG